MKSLVAAPIDLKTELNLLSEDEVLALRGLKSKQTLRNERANGKGPPYCTLGNKTFYPYEKFKQYIAAEIITPTRVPTMKDAKSGRFLKPAHPKARPQNRRRAKAAQASAAQL